MKKYFKIFSLIVLACILWTFGVSGQTYIAPYPYMPSMPIPNPYMIGPAGGLIYGISQAPHYAGPDNREWAGRGQHKFVIRSWSLDLFNGPHGGTPYAHVPGFCSVTSALTHGRRNFPNQHSMTMPSPLPCWRVDGTGAR